VNSVKDTLTLEQLLARIPKDAIDQVLLLAYFDQTYIDVKANGEVFRYWYRFSNGSYIEYTQYKIGEYIKI
jgi:hypothetical protein